MHKKSRKNYDVQRIAEIPVVYMYPQIQFDNLRFMQMGPTWLASKDNGGGGVMNGAISLFLQEVHDIGIVFHLQYILVLQITSSLITREILVRVKPLQKMPRRDQKSWKVENSKIAISQKNALLAKLLKQDRERPLVEDK